MDTSRIASGSNWKSEKMFEIEARSRVRKVSFSTFLVACSLLLAACSGDKEEQAKGKKKLTFTNHTSKRHNSNKSGFSENGIAKGARAQLVPMEPKVAIKVPPAPVLPATKPVVVFSAGHAATNLIKLGDVFPAATLPNTAGQQHELSGLFGQRL